MRRAILAISLITVTLLIVAAPSASADSKWVKYPGNPILRPTAGSWDSWGVLLPRILFDGSMFRMWYLGYEACPSSTTGGGQGGGKIGYATSKDGLTWVKQASPVLSPGPSGSWDSGEVQPGSVVWNRTHFLMWYTGYGKWAGTSDSCNTGTCYGGVGLAVSEDGVSWIKYPGNPLMKSNETDTDGISYPYVIRDHVTYRMWYSDLKCAACSGINIFFSTIRHATSTDGIHWVKDTSPVLKSGSYQKSWDDAGVYSPTVIYNGSAYWMWYSAYNTNSVNGLFGVATMTIGYATSKDGLSWTKSEDNPILGLGPPGSWDGSQHADLQDTVLVNNTVLLYYSANSAKTKSIQGSQGDPYDFKIGLATSPQGFAIPELPFSSGLILATLIGAVVVVVRKIQVQTSGPER